MTHHPRRRIVRSRARTLTCLLGVCVVAGLAGSAPAPAHTLGMVEALDRVNAYAQRLVDDTRLPWVAKQVTCYRLFPHQIRCYAKYDTAATRPTTRYACVERVLAYFSSHHIGAQYEVQGGYLKHDSQPCGLIRLTGPAP